MDKPLSLDEWTDKISRLEQAKQNQDWEAWQRIAHEGEESNIHVEHRGQLRS